MAYVGPTVVNENDTGLYIVKWTGITDDDDDSIEAFKIEGFDDITVYMFGTVSASSALRVWASPEKTRPVSDTAFYAPMQSAGADIVLTSANTCALLDTLGLWYKPHLTGGDVSTDLDFYLVCR
jgi:hypothetical protein